MYLSDAAEYQKERGFYDLIKNYVYDLAVYDELGLSLAIQEVLQRTDFRTTNSEFMSKFMGACDGEATQRLEKLVKNLIEG